MNGLGLDGRKREMRGTMEVTVRQPTIGAEWADVKADVGRLMRAVVDMAKSKTGEKTGKKKAAS